MELDMDYVAFFFGTLSLGLLTIAIVWVVVVMARTSWWWLLGFFVVLPLFVFVFRHPRRLRIPGLLVASSIALQFAALIAAGDLFRNRHPDEPPGRTPLQRAFGCSGSALWSDLIGSRDKPLEDWLRDFRLDAETGSTEISAAVMSVLASALSYVPPDRIKTMGSLNPFLQRTTVLVEGPHQAVVVTSDRLIIVAFRGTDDADDWRRNFKAIPAATGLGIVHAGFLEGYRALSLQVIRAVTAARDNDQAVWLTGHSLGGAMAVLAAPELHAATKRLDGIVTFGQPPVGYPAFAEAWETTFPKRLVRYVNHRDVVADVISPLALPFAELTHTGEVRYFDTAGILHTSGVPAMQFLRDAVCAPLFESGAEVKAHYIRRYLALVLKASEGATP